MVNNKIEPAFFETVRSWFEGYALASGFIESVFDTNWPFTLFCKLVERVRGQLERSRVIHFIKYSSRDYGFNMYSTQSISF